MSKETGWIGVDLDGTLAEYHGWRGLQHIGDPIPAMVERVKAWLEEGQEVRIFTARVADEANRGAVIVAIDAWCLDVFGRVFPVTNVKDFGMVALYDDRAVQVEHNTGRRIGDHPPTHWTPLEEHKKETARG